MVGFDEVILIFIVALLLFGPDKLPQYLRELGKIYAEVKKAQREFERELTQPAKEALVSKPAIKPPSEKVSEIARKMGISPEGKSEEQLLAEIDAAVPATKAPVQAPEHQGEKKDI